MPVEYRFTGVSRNSERPENSTIRSNFFATSLLDKPRIAPFRYMFSRPVRSG